MKQVCGLWLPDGERHLIPFLERGPQFGGGPTYQLHKLMAAMPHIRNFRHAIDVGAHCGLWSRVLARMFAHLTAFEPLPAHRECFMRNVIDASSGITDLARVTLNPCALGSRDGFALIERRADSSGDSHIAGAGEQVEMRRLDSFGLGPVDFLKIDCEGYEKFVLEGGEETVRGAKPCIVVEQKPKKASQYGLGDQDAVALLQGWGATLRWEISGDFCLSW